jgi:hypothetical protein
MTDRRVRSVLWPVGLRAQNIGKRRSRMNGERTGYDPDDDDDDYGYGETGGDEEDDDPDDDEDE